MLDLDHYMTSVRDIFGRVELHSELVALLVSRRLAGKYTSGTWAVPQRRAIRALVDSLYVGGIGPRKAYAVIVLLLPDADRDAIAEQIAAREYLAY